jgi:hypothetical protein
VVSLTITNDGKPSRLGRSRRRPRRRRLAVPLPYAPLFAILAIRFRTAWLEIACAALASLGLAAGVAVIARYRRLAGQRWTATQVEDRGYEVAGYLDLASGCDPASVLTIWG